jgi:hypothetical protein
MNMFCDWLADTKEIIVGDSFFRKLILYSCIVFRFIQPNEPITKPVHVGS